MLKTDLNVKLYIKIIISFLFLFSCTKSQIKHKINITTSTPNANIFINKQFYGKEKAKFLSSTNQWIKVKVQEKNHYPLIQNIYISTSTNINLKLIPKKTTLTLKFNTPPTKVFIDKKEIKERYKIPISFGKHQIFVFKTGYPFIKKAILINKEKHYTKKIILKKIKITSSLIISSTPKNISIFIEKNKISTTPFSFKGLTPGNYSFSFEKKGYSSKNILISLKKREKRSIIVRLEALPSTITFNSLANKTTICIQKDDGQEIQLYYPKQKTVNLLNGEYTYVIRNKNFLPIIERLKITQTTNIFFHKRLKDINKIKFITKKNYTSPIFFVPTKRKLLIQISKTKKYFVFDKNSIPYETNLDISADYKKKTNSTIINKIINQNGNIVPKKVTGFGKSDNIFLLGEKNSKYIFLYNAINLKYLKKIKLPIKINKTTQIKLLNEQLAIISEDKNLFLFRFENKKND